MLRLSFLCLFICALLSSARADALRVNPSAPGPAHDGRSWATAYLAVQDAVDAASTGDEVWVAAGVYRKALLMKEGVSLYGGFAGSETALEQRDADIHESILDGKGLRASIVTFPTGVTAATALDGFTIRDGAGTPAGNVAFGGGIHCVNASPVISHNRFSDNRPSSSVYEVPAGYGGGIYCAGSAGPLIQGNVFDANSADGSAVYAGPDAAPVITGNILTSNTGASVVHSVRAALTLSNNTFTDNSGTGVLTESATATITGNVVRGQAGAGAACLGGRAIITDNTFQGNGVQGGTPTGYGGAISCADGNGRPVEALIANNVLLANATPIGAVAVIGGTVSILNNTIVANRGDRCGGIYLEATGNGWMKATVANNLVAFNYGQGVRKTGSNSATVTLRANNLFGNAVRAGDPPDYGGLPSGATDISADPRLAGLPWGNLHLTPGSPCRDAGNTDDARPLGEDQDGRPRVQGAAADIGAYEFDGADRTGPPAVVRVSASGDDANDGTSWQKARKTVQGGIAAARWGGEVWVAGGAYAERVRVPAFVHLYGGFAGTETERAARNWAAQPTTLDGETGGTVVTFAPNAPYGGLDGFRVINGKGDDSGGLDAPGAYPWGWSDPPGAGLTVAHNVFTRNTGKLTGGAYIAGPAAIHDNVFFNNGATGVGALQAGRGARVMGNTVVANSGQSGCLSAGPASLMANNIVAFNFGGATVGQGGTMRNNCLYGYEDAGYVPGVPDGNLRADPHFAAWRQGDLRLQPDSPCVDTGDGLLAVGDRDAAGGPRVRGAGVDIGALESDGTVFHVTPRIIHLAPAGDDANDGLSWQHAKGTVGAALEAVAAGGDVWVAQGTYLPDTTFTATLPSLVRMYGGFRGGEVEAGQRDPEQYPTILEVGVSIAANAIHGALDGFTIRRGGVYVGGGSPNEIAHNQITGSTTGITLTDGSIARIHDNVIRGNTQAGIAGGEVNSLMGSPLISGNTIVENGGAGVDLRGGQPTLDRNIVRANAVGGVRFLAAAPDRITLSSNLIAGNGNDADGFGGVRLESFGSGTDDAIAILTNNTVVHNRAAAADRQGRAAGILIRTYDRASLIANNIVAFNQGSGIAVDPNARVLPDLHANDVFANAGENYQNVTDPTGTDGNISADPLFVDGLHGDYHILPGSLAVDAGDSSLILPNALDLDGAPRTRGARVDIGAYETLHVPTQDDAFRALRVAAGLGSLAQVDMALLDVEDSAGSAGVVDLLDALALLRRVMGVGG